MAQNHIMSTLLRTLDERHTKRLVTAAAVLCLKIKTVFTYVQLVVALS